MATKRAAAPAHQKVQLVAAVTAAVGGGDPDQQARPSTKDEQDAAAQAIVQHMFLSTAFANWDHTLASVAELTAEQSLNRQQAVDACMAERTVLAQQLGKLLNQTWWKRPTRDQVMNQFKAHAERTQQDWLDSVFGKPEVAAATFGGPVDLSAIGYIKPERQGAPSQGYES